MLPDLSRLRYKRNLLSDPYNLSTGTLCKKELSASFYQMIKRNKNKKKETEQTITINVFTQSKAFASINIHLIILVYTLF